MKIFLAAFIFIFISIGAIIVLYLWMRSFMDRKVVDKDLYSITASESNILFEAEDYYYYRNGFIGGNFSYPQDKVFTDNPGEYTFNGSITFYADGDKSAVIVKYYFMLFRCI